MGYFVVHISPDMDKFRSKLHACFALPRDVAPIRLPQQYTSRQPIPLAVMANTSQPPKNPVAST
jgi:hypothetical protein